MKSSIRKISTALIMVASVAGLSSNANADEMVLASWGGTYQTAIKDAWIKPFTEKTGISVIEDTEPEIARIRGMVDTNNVEWDVVTGGGSTLMQGIKYNLFEKITPEMVDQKEVLEGARSDFGVPSEIFSTVIGYSKKDFPEGGPRTFADFWDVKKFPGKRSLPNKPSTVLEAALLADGVALNEVYNVLSTPEGMERALDKIREIKPHVAVWWSSGAQPVQALGSGEVVMALGWNGRFQSGIDQGLDIDMSWDQSVAQVGFFMIVKNAPNKENAVKFLNFMITPEAQAEFSKYVAYGPVTSKSLDLIDETRLSRLPSTKERIVNAVFEDLNWWEKNSVSATEQYTAVIQE